MTDDGRRTIREQRELYRRYAATLPRTGEPWYIHPRMDESWNPPTLAERIDRLERELKMGRYAEDE